MVNERFWMLVSLKLSGEATPGELQELNGLLQEQPGLGLQLEAFEKIWSRKLAGFGPDTATAYNKHLQRLSNHLSTPVLKYETNDPPLTSDEPLPVDGKIRRKRFFLFFTAVAASFILFFSFFYGIDNFKRKNLSDARNTVSTKPGSKSKIQLPDGTQVWLNADSKLTYDENFLGDFREVQLTGEAYFDVAKDKDHPFIIHTQSIDLKVLGTAFNVRAYSNEKNTEASLIHGSIEVTLLKSPDKKIILKPNEKLIIQNDDFLSAAAEKKKTPATKNHSPIMVLDKVHFLDNDSSAAEVLWTRNKLAFDGESLADIAPKIERWYDVKISIVDEKLRDSEYSGVFTDETIGEVMEALRLTGNFRYVINKKEVIIGQDTRQTK